MNLSLRFSFFKPGQIDADDVLFEFSLDDLDRGEFSNGGRRNVTDGDWLFSSADGMWTPFNQRVAVSVNWNVRGIVEIAP